VKIVETSLPGVIQIEPDVFGDERGFFIETYSEKRYQEAGINERFVQDNHSRSRQGVVRGLHYQLNHPQGKLIRVVRGSVFDVAVDIRLGSPTFGKAAWTVLSDENHYQFYVPPGFAHGFCVVSQFCDFESKCTDYYAPDDEGAVLWNDPDLEIPWPVASPQLSDKDTKALCLKDIPQDRLPVYPGD
jgi:dTDP-4-dehydrorhamnose 3,5-epimerase